MVISNKHEMLPSLARLAPTGGRVSGDGLGGGMSDAELKQAAQEAQEEGEALMARRAHLNQRSEAALRRYMNYMDSLHGNNHQKNWRAKLDALKARWNEAKQRCREADNAVDDAINRFLELQQELERRGLSL